MRSFFLLVLPLLSACYVARADPHCFVGPIEGDIPAHLLPCSNPVGLATFTTEGHFVDCAYDDGNATWFRPRASVGETQCWEVLDDAERWIEVAHP